MEGTVIPVVSNGLRLPRLSKDQVIDIWAAAAQREAPYSIPGGTLSKLPLGDILQLPPEVIRPWRIAETEGR